MISNFSRGNRTGVLLLLAFLLVLHLTGGSSRADEPAQLFIRIAAIGFGAVGLLRIQRVDALAMRIPLIGLAAAAALVIVQLVPLPPELWTRLPGRADFARVDDLAGLGRIWRPLTLTPDLALNGLVSLLPPVATVLLVAPLTTRDLRVPIMLLVVLAALGAALGLLQVGGSIANFYGQRVHGFGGATGFFANRNHHAAVLVTALPMIAWLARDGEVTHVFRRPAALAVAAFIAVGVVASGSRAGLALMLLAMAASWLILTLSPIAPARPPRSQRARLLLFVATGIAAITTVVLLVRSETVQRLLREDAAEEVRVKLFGHMVRIGEQYFPFGSGFGSFVDVFKLHERLDDLQLQYLNHAHNDLLELFVEGGPFALLVAFAGMGWLTIASVRAWRDDARRNQRAHLARVGSVMAGTLVLASLADYPLRTPLGMSLLAFAACLLARLAASREATARRA